MEKEGGGGKDDVIQFSTIFIEISLFRLES